MGVHNKWGVWAISLTLPAKNTAKKETTDKREGFLSLNLKLKWNCVCVSCRGGSCALLFLALRFLTETNRTRV